MATRASLLLLLCLAGVGMVVAQGVPKAGLAALEPGSPASAVQVDNRISAIGNVSLSEEFYTKPSADPVLSFSQPGHVAKVLVKEGDSAQAGQVLVQLDDEAERIALAQQEAAAKDNIRVDAAERQNAQKTVDYQKTLAAAEKGAANAWEVEHAKLDMEIAKLSLDLAKFEKEQEGRKYDELKVRVDRMGLKSTVSGLVEEILIQAGESVDTATKIVKVVRLDPLWIDASMPLSLARHLEAGNPVGVRFVEEAPGQQKVQGRIRYVRAVANPAGEIEVQVELPNPTLRKAGERVQLDFAYAPTTQPGAPPPLALPREGGGHGVGAAQTAEQRRNKP